MFPHKDLYTVCSYGNPVLREAALPVAAVTQEIRDLAESMKKTLTVFEGIGLAAPQVGKSFRLVVFDVPQESSQEPLTPGEALLLPQMPFVAVNPEIVAMSGDSVPYKEGCLSVPDIFAEVLRPSCVVFRTQTLSGEVIECECGGLLGRCIQHELDHLAGKLFIDRLTPETLKKVSSRLRALQKYGARHKFLRTERV